MNLYKLKNISRALAGSRNKDQEALLGAIFASVPRKPAGLSSGSMDDGGYTMSLESRSRAIGFFNCLNCRRPVAFGKIRGFARERIEAFSAQCALLNRKFGSNIDLDFI